MIEFRSVTKSFRDDGKRGSSGRRAALLPVSLEIPPGEFFSIVGPSGCGKSTLLNLLAGFLEADGGTVLLDGEKVRRPGPDRAMVFQEAGLLPWMTVLQNVEYGLKLQGIASSDRREKAIRYLQMVHLARFADARPHQLSGGMRQRVAIARALALEPKVLLMDEPFSALDSQTRDVLHEELQRVWSETHTTVVFVTHNLEEAVYLSDRILIMTASPGRVKSLVRVPLPRPRHKASSVLLDFAASLHHLIAEEVNKVAAEEMDPDWVPEQEEPAAEVYEEGQGI
jgi:NitT/TauT family transport system ATP-binding protein